MPAGRAILQSLFSLVNVPTFAAEPFNLVGPFKDLALFYEYFDGDTGRGVGASHQTGWTGLVAKLLEDRCRRGQIDFG